MRILIVDDDKTTRKLLSIYLKGSGFNVVTAENGLDAIEKLGMDNINLVMTDLNMPYMDGIELVKNIRSDPNLSHIPVLMVTTEADPVEEEKAFSAGVSGFITKPVTAGVVTQNIKELLKKLLNKGGALNV